MSRNYKALKQAVIELSEADDLSAFNEWSHTYTRRDHEGGGECLCGKRPIVNVVGLVNRATGHNIEVGNECVGHFGMNFAEEFRAEQRKEHEERRAEKHADQLQKIQDYLHDRANEFESSFLLTVIRSIREGWELSPKQQSVYAKIKARMNEEVSDDAAAKIAVMDKFKPQTAWENKFWKSIKESVERDYHLSEKQRLWVDKLLRKAGSSIEEFDNPAQAAPKKEEVPASELDFKELTPRDWQLRAYQAWQDANHTGTVEAGTGSGKTYLGIMAVLQHGEPWGVIVPTEHLQHQWRDEIRSIIPDADIGLVGGGHNERGHQITIAIVNSIRYEDFAPDNVVLDEAHRYASQENIKFLIHGSYKRVLALSATIEREDSRHKLLTNMYPVVYKLTQGDAIKEGYIAPYRVIHAGVQLTRGERVEYDTNDSSVRRAMKLFGGFPAMRRAIRSGDSRAADGMRAVTRRKSIVWNAENKVPAVHEVLMREKNGQLPKTIVFSQLKKTAAAVRKDLKKRGVEAAIYHSGLSSKDRQAMLADFKEGRVQVMVAVKALDEGVDVPDCEVAVILAGSSVKRQLIQRVGRVLRARPGKEARVYFIYAEGTKDIDWITKATEGLTNVPSEHITLTGGIKA